MSKRYVKIKHGECPTPPTPTEAIFISVAAEENQLANLIEQEVEKIRQFLCMKPNMDELFELNDRINRFLTNLILKEVVLAVKLNEALALADETEEFC